jgi:hypothetical protein
MARSETARNPADGIACDLWALLPEVAPAPSLLPFMLNCQPEWASGGDKHVWSTISWHAVAARGCDASSWPHRDVIAAPAPSLIRSGENRLRTRGQAADASGASGAANSRSTLSVVQAVVLAGQLILVLDNSICLVDLPSAQLTGTVSGQDLTHHANSDQGHPGHLPSPSSARLTMAYPGGETRVGSARTHVPHHCRVPPHSHRG